MEERLPSSKLLVLEWHSGLPLLHGLISIDYGMEIETIAEHVPFDRESIIMFLEKAFGEGAKNE